MWRRRTQFVVGTLVLLSACAFIFREKRTQPLVEFFSYSSIGQNTPKSLIDEIIEGLENQDANPNTHTMGIRALLHFNPRAWLRSGIRAERTPNQKAHFLGLGADGFLLATMADNGLLQTLNVYSRYNIPYPPEFATQSSRSELTSSWEKSFPPQAIAIATTPVLGPETTCVPRGAHTIQETYFVRPTEHTGCLFFRTPIDTRFSTENFRSKLACFNTKLNQFWDTRLDKAQFVFPVSESQIAVYEGAYTPPRITRFNLETGEATEEPRKQTTIINSAKPESVPIPESPMGLYECSQSAARISPNDIVKTDQKSFYMIDSEVFEGSREPRPGEDFIWQVGFDIDNHLFTQRLSWQQANSLFPGFSDFPAPICATAETVDVKCGLATLQMSANLAMEILAGNETDTRIRAHKSLMAFTLLNNLPQKMGSWLLDVEVWKFLQLFANDVKKSPEAENLPTSDLKAVKDFLETTEPSFENKTPEAHKTLRGYLSVPEAFWNALMQSQK